MIQDVHIWVCRELHGLSEYVITFVKAKSDSNGIGYKTSFLDIVLYNIVEYCLKNVLYTEIQYHKILKT